jgi:light-regulated signal transduction histidine kinase (bacteriophytochrome)
MKPPAATRTKSSDPEARIAALQAELDQTRDQMRSFSYSVSHDLRAPLRAIEGFGRILLEDYAEKMDEEGKRFLNNVLTNAQVMTTLIDDLLVFHRVGEKQLSKSPVDMNQLTQDILDVVLKSAPTKPEVKLPPLPTINADMAQVRVAWEQLISNAVKFTKRESKPVIEFGSSQKDGEQIFWVRDNGVGFEMQYADKLFQIFQKLQRDADFEGNGIGLALVKRVAEKHGGRAWAEAKPNEGATFYLALPRET